MDLDNLKGNLKKEYGCPYVNKQLFFEYYKGEQIQEFIDLPKVVYNEWKYWKNEFNRSMWKPVEKDTFDKYFQAFKDYWQYYTPETQQVFKEMNLLSHSMITEWRQKYTFDSAYKYNGCYSYDKDYRLKTKSQLWEEFKTIWDLIPEDYSEHLLTESEELINKYLCDDTNYFEEYPRNFQEYRENANYHSFDSYNVLKQYNICQEWENYIQKKIKN